MLVVTACYIRTLVDCAPARRSNLLTHSSLVRVPVGGDQRRVEIHLIAHPDDDQTEARRLLKEQFASFDAGKARCFLASDREHLLAVIEASFGNFHDFNRVARNLFASRIDSQAVFSSRRSRSFDILAFPVAAARVGPALAKA